MDLETMPRRTGRPHAGRPRGRRAAALAALVLAAVTAVAGCDGDGKSASDAAASTTASASATAPSASASGSASVPAPATTPDPGSPPVATPPADPSAPTPDPRPASPSPATVPPKPPQSPTPAPTPPGNGIAVGEPAPNGPSTHPAITYRADGNRLTVWFYGGICEKYGLKADESHPGRVDIRVVIAAPVPAGQACNEIAKRQTVVADLKQPLMGRAVTDQSSGQPVPLDADPRIGPDPVGPEVAGGPQ
ncbi:hypothetical protein ACFVVX_02040 [Kitasatospora sp. NPDC058170]|uniref:hypothetical protein n=1 Tax=Kitasatospora sp. NPDC058170 TaxID=3346364 RepID=UPI0036D976B5